MIDRTQVLTQMWESSMLDAVTSSPDLGEDRPIVGDAAIAEAAAFIYEPSAT